MAKSRKGRIHLLDEIRGAAILCMVVFHGLLTLSLFFDLPFAGQMVNFFGPAVLWFAGLFILLSGISSRLSRSNAKRGGKLLAIALVLTLVTWVLEEKFGFGRVTIWFGILHLLSLSMLLYALLHKGLDKLHPLIALLLFGGLFAATFHLSDGYLGFADLTLALPDWLTRQRFLFPIGIVGPDFVSADYYPLFPWVFLFFLGASIGRWFKEGKLPAFFYNEHLRPLAACGRHTLMIYLAHQPVIYGLAWVVQRLLSLAK